MAERTRAVAYLRVSTTDQAEHGVSLDAQRARVVAYAALYDLELVDVIVDAGASAKTLDREGLKRALGMLRAGAAHALIVAKLDRLTRVVAHLGQLVEHYFTDGRFALLSVGEQIDTRSAGGKLVLNVLGSVSQWEREVIAERTSAAMRHKVAAGEFVGGTPPYGFRVDAAGRLDPVQSEQAVIDRARELRDSGLSLRRVGIALQDAGMRSRTGNTFLPAQIARMLATVQTTVRETVRDLPTPSATPTP